MDVSSNAFPSSTPVCSTCGPAHKSHQCVWSGPSTPALVLPSLLIWYKLIGAPSKPISARISILYGSLLSKIIALKGHMSGSKMRKQIVIYGCIQHNQEPYLASDLDISSRVNLYLALIIFLISDLTSAKSAVTSCRVGIWKS